MISHRLLTGDAIDDQALEALAQLRLQVFRHWPYLYQGDLDYERDYLESYRSDGSIIVAAYDGDAMIGAATAAPMEQHHQEFGQAFSQSTMLLEDIYYLAESVLLPPYRGRGLGHIFFDAREVQARQLQRGFCAFCSVIRPSSHPARPKDYRPLDDFWRKRGYAPLDGVIAHFSWKDSGEREESLKPMQFWMRKL